MAQAMDQQAAIFANDRDINNKQNAANREGTPLIEVCDLCFRYEEEQAELTIDHANFSIEAGAWAAIIGHNGSGKSTIAKLLDGLLEAESGDITIGGVRLSEATLWDVRDQIGIVFQNPDNQFVGATVEDDVAFALENQGVARNEMLVRVERALRQVDMWQYRDREPATLSGGQKQRVAIAGVLAMRPKIIILDEATAMLDPEGRSEVMRILQTIKADEHITVLSITHDIDEAAMADTVLVVSAGRIVRQGKPQEIFQAGLALPSMGLDVPFAEKLRLALVARGLAMPDYVDEKGLISFLWPSN